MRRKREGKSQRKKEIEAGEMYKKRRWEGEVKEEKY